MRRPVALALLAVLAGALPDAARAAGVLAVRDRASASQAEPQVGSYRNPVFDLSFPDPTGLRTGVDFYAYGTGGRFPVLHSTDLVHWERRGTAFAAPASWSRGRNPWAPSAVAADRPCPGTASPTCYVLYYVGSHPGLRPAANCVGVAFATHPAGPFTDLGLLRTAERAPGYADLVLGTSGLHGHWRLGDRRGRVIVDASGRRSGTYVGRPRLGVQGAVGDDEDRAVAFRGRGQGGRLPRVVAGDVTVSFWFRSREGGAGRPVRDWRQAAGLVDARVAGRVRDFGTSLDAAGRVWAGTGSPTRSIRSGPGHDDGRWHQVVFTRTQATGRMRLHVDGAEVAAGRGGTRRLDRPRALLLAATGPRGETLHGALDEVAVWRRALSPAEIAQQFNRPAVGCADGRGWSTIDPAPFVDHDGRAYLYVSTTNPERTLGVIPLTEDLTRAAGPRVPLLQATEAWEQTPWEPVVEAPWVLRRNADDGRTRYYLFYSGGAFNGDYAMGYATGPTPTGPFVKSADPILRSTPGVLGPGGGSLVTGPRTGADFMLYNARTRLGGPRLLFLDRVTWDGARPTVAGPTTTPQALP